MAKLDGNKRQSESKPINENNYHAYEKQIPHESLPA